MQRINQCSTHETVSSVPAGTGWANVWKVTASPVPRPPQSVMKAALGAQECVKNEPSQHRAELRLPGGGAQTWQRGVGAERC